MTQKSLLHAVAAQIANGYETAEVPMYSEQLRMPDRKVIIKIIENLQDEDEDVATDAAKKSDEEEIIDYSNYTPTEPKEEDAATFDDEDLVDEDKLYK